MSNLELLDRAAGATTCQILSTAGQTLVGVGVYSLWASGTGVVPLSAGALSLLASNYLCPEMPMGGGTGGGINGCGQMAPGGYGRAQRSTDGGEDWRYWGDDYFHNFSVTSISKGEVKQGNFNTWNCVITIVNRDGEVKVSDSFPTKYGADIAQYRILPTSGECASEQEPNLPEIPPEATQPITYTDNVTNCTYNVTLQGFAQESEGGSVQPVFLVERAIEQRADGGLMGGCNFAPTIYMPPGGGGGGGVYVPVPDGGGDGGDGVPWWVPALAGALGGAIANQILDSIGDALAPKFEPATFTLTAPCDVDENGEPQFRTWDFAEGNFQQRVNAHQVALMEIMQQHLDWKTPTCSSSRPPLEGEWVTTRWISDEKMDHSGRELRKLFRYRSKSSRELQQLSSYWESFTWRSGNVCVIHKDAWWGTPQVWAESAEEGKRVIRFAGAEAGIDPDQVGRWEISGSRTPRYGMSGTMRVLQHKGFPWVASRDGADWPNLLAKEL